ncbi:hypothetical protein SLEP1_g18437 [Rubroshorea leprosula]|uniref:Arf-GAP domain-containing protein n=1 Tax=Rubroshorea leprosula TaxID=152421 RepID=A0AAV5IXE9_9ROSI|nr:hypothetical protein SLEP1_g18437 [Rubroshorea leprosula]
MASRLKEEEKNERIIRGLLKLHDNRKCINCNSMGPQYVCTNFWTFVCTTCSGIHREFTHRVKSVSMAKFTSQEVTSLQEGGNQRAKEIYLKEWDPQRNSFPDSSNVERLRDFIKHTYLDRRYSGERNYDKPPRAKMGDKEDFNDNRRKDGYQGGSRSPPYEDSYERRYSERSSPGARSDDRNSRYNYDERRSPGYDQESRQYGDYRRSPARPEIVSDWRREDRFSNGRKPEDRRSSDGDSRLEGRSPERPKDLESSSPPVVRPVREILGENVLPLRIQEPPKANGSRTANAPLQTQRTASSSSLGSVNDSPTEVKLKTTVSLIDFDADPEPPAAATTVTAQQTTMTQSIVQPTSSANDNNWASFDNAVPAQISQAPSNVNSLDSVLSQLSVPAPIPVHPSGPPSSFAAPVATSLTNTLSPLAGDLNTAPIAHGQTTPLGAGAPTSAPTAPVGSFSTFPSNGVMSANPGMITVSGGSSLVNINDAGQWPSMQHQQPSLVSPAVYPSPSQQFVQPVDGAQATQPRNFSVSQKMHGPFSTPAAQAPQAISNISQVATSTGALQPSPIETESTGRKELPEGLFTATYPIFLAPVPGWHSGFPRGMGFPMQYNTAVLQQMPTFPQSSRSINPFDVNTEAPAVQTQTFPSMGSLQGALPNMPLPSGLVHTSSLGTPPARMPPQSLPSASAMPSQALPYASALPQRTYMGPQGPNTMMPPSHQVGGIGSKTGFGFINMDQQLASGFSAPATQRPSSSFGGNPFG